MNKNIQILIKIAIVAILFINMPYPKVYSETLSHASKEKKEKGGSGQEGHSAQRLQHCL